MLKSLGSISSQDPDDNRLVATQRREEVGRAHSKPKSAKQQIVTIGDRLNVSCRMEEELLTHAMLEWSGYSNTIGASFGI